MLLRSQSLFVSVKNITRDIYKNEMLVHNHLSFVLLQKAIEYYTRVITVYGAGSKAHVYLLHRTSLYCKTLSFEVNKRINYFPVHQSTVPFICCGGASVLLLNKRRETLLVSSPH